VSIPPAGSSEQGLIIAPLGRDAMIAAGILGEAGLLTTRCRSIGELMAALSPGAGFVVATEEALMRTDLASLKEWIDAQEEWSDLPFILLTHRGGGLERNPQAARLLHVLGNVSFVERPFHPTTLVSMAQSALRARRRQYEARARLLSLQRSEDQLRTANQTLEERVEARTREHEVAVAQLHEAQKLETLGQLTGGIAHDFNNLLTPVIGNLDLLRRRLPEEDAKLHRLVDNGLKAASRAATLVQRLLAFARRQDLQARPVAIAGLLEGMTDLLTRSLGPTIEISIEVERDLPAARVDPNQLELALLNLSINARDAMPGGGRLSIRADSADPSKSDRLAPGRYIRIAVSDAGTGMDAGTLARSIEPFFSTKGVGKGTGLGLSMVHGLAAQLGGRLTLSSELGRGTVASIWLPATEEAVDDVRSDCPMVEPAAGRATLLLVDDEELVRNGTAELLRDIGYDVVTADGGSDALSLLRGGAEFDMIITDYLMPGMNGAELVYQVHSIYPGMPALLVTGYSTIASGRGASLPRLGKPFRQAELAARVADLLRPPSSERVVQIRTPATR
jgi:signal transduction histidine kinase/CheY-like chemotaxis protein